MREIRQSGSEGGGAEITRLSLPLSVAGVSSPSRICRTASPTYASSSGITRAGSTPVSRWSSPRYWYENRS